MRSYERPTVGLILVAPSSVLHSMLPRMIAHGGPLGTEGDQAPTTKDDAQLPQIIVEPLSRDTLEELTRLIEQTSPVQILVFCEEETYRELSGREGLSAHALDELAGSQVVGEQILSAVLSAVRSGQGLFSGEETPLRIEFQGLLSARELEVLELLAEGASNKQISEDLSISPNTVYTHVRHIQSKLRTANRTQTALLARTSSSRREPQTTG